MRPPTRKQRHAPVGGRPLEGHDPGLRFWLSYAESEGALVEDSGDHALAVLPQSLQEEADLPEDVVVTSDPDVAREDGAILLISGHPALERAAEAVLGAGDVGHLHLSWPTSERPPMSVLQARARERFQVEHGRIDAAGEARRAYLPLLRAGAMITYSASLALRFQEQEEAWVDATTGLAVPDRVRRALDGHPRLPEPDAPHRPLQIDMGLALAGAHAQLEERAAARRGSLALQARRALESELVRADAYYHGALESIERRRVSAAPDRRLLLDGQAEATRAEHARRRREIEEELQARHEIRPFRLQLLHAPALVLPVEIRRGARSFPFAFVWLSPAGAFTDVRCPHCGAAAELAAGRERLGCRACLHRPTAARKPGDGAPEVAAAEQSPRSRSERSDPPRSSPAPTAAPLQPRPSTTPTAAPGRNGDTGSREGPARPTPGARAPSPPPRRRKRGDDLPKPGCATRSVEHTGNKLALAFWQTVADGRRWRGKKVARDSPLSAIYRLFGPAGPVCAVGMAPGDWPSEVTAGTLPPESGCPELTTGTVGAGETSYPYALRWWLHGGKPVVAEVMPAPHPAVLAPASATETMARLRDRAPSPGIDLDPVAAALWRAELRSVGLPIAVRCLATWWRVRESVDPCHDPAAIAAAVAGAVARAARLRRGRAETATTYGAALEAVDRVASELGSGLRLDRDRGW